MPHKGFRVRIGCGEELIDRPDQSRNTLETISPHPLLGQLSEPSLYQVQPRRTGRCKVEREPRVFVQPRFDLKLLVSPVVVNDEVQLIERH